MAVQQRITKTPKQLERYMKGVANHHRIHVLELVWEMKSLTLEDIAKQSHMNIKTASEHTRRLVQAGLLNKKYHGRSVMHTLSPYGKRVYAFLTTFSHS